VRIAAPLRPAARRSAPVAKRGLAAWGPLAAALLALPLAACFVPIEKGRQMEARIQKLEVQNVENERALEEQKQSYRERTERLDQKLKEVQTKIDELNQAAKRSGADLGVTLSRLQEDFARVKGELEVAQHRLGEIDKATTALRADTDARFAALKGQGAMDAYEARQKIAALKKPDDKGAVLGLAQQQEEKGEKGIAREIYEEYVRKWPSDPKAAEAGFRAGEILYAQGRYRDALLSYGRVAESFPRSDRAPGAMLGAGESMLKLEMKEDAASVLGQLVERYPKSDAAARAKALLKELAPPPAAPAKKPAEKPKGDKKKPAK
jgi:tol-pal system protein YbgF